MTHISGFERSQLLLLPEALDDYVDAKNPVRFIDAFIDVLDLRRRRKNMQKHQLPHLVADRAGTVVGYAYAVPFRKNAVKLERPGERSSIIAGPP